MTTSIKHKATQNHMVPFYDDELLRGLSEPWNIAESERNIIARYTTDGDSDWLISYYDPEQNIAYGFVRLAGDNRNSEWGEIDMEWLEGMSVTRPVFIHGQSVPLKIPVVERDDRWEPCVFAELRRDPTFAWINESNEVQPLR